MATVSSYVAPIAGLSQTLFGRTPVQLSSNRAADIIAQTSLGFASFGLAPLILSLRGADKVYDPVLQLKKMQKELEKGRHLGAEFRKQESWFRRKRLGRLKRENQGEWSPRASKDTGRILLHHQLFGDLTAREILWHAAPRKLAQSREFKPKFGLIPAGTRMDLAEKRAALASIPSLEPYEGSPRVFTREEIEPHYAAHDALMATRGRFAHLESARTHYGQNTIEQTLERQAMRLAISQPSVGTLTGDDSLGAVSAPMPPETVPTVPTVPTVTTPPPLRDSERVTVQVTTPLTDEGADEMSITGTPTSGFNQVMGGITDAVTGLATPSGIQSIASLVGAIRGGGGAVPAALNPMGVGLPFVQGAVLPGGVSTQVASPIQGTGVALDLPFVDVVAQGAGAITQPFHTTSSGNQVAQPFVKSKENGKTEWFIPAGQPKTWSKASVKRRHRHAHHHPR